MRGLHRRVRWSGRHWRSSRVLPSVGLLQAIPVRRPQDGDRNSITEELGIASDEASCPVVQVGGSGATEIAPASHADRERADGVDDEIPHCRSEEHTSELQSLMRISYAVFFLKKQIDI